MTIMKILHSVYVFFILQLLLFLFFFFFFFFVFGRATSDFFCLQAAPTSHQLLMRKACGEPTVKLISGARTFK